MFGLTFDKLVIIAVIAVFLVGPERLPLYAGRFAELVRTLRDFADSAKARLKEELGPEMDDVDWKKMDPRQYDPRRIVREALADDIALRPASTPTPAPEDADAPTPESPPVPVMRAGSDGRYRRHDILQPSRVALTGPPSGDTH
jgi:sec-independent protein translocase protein TatB